MVGQGPIWLGIFLAVAGIAIAGGARANVPGKIVSCEQAAALAAQSSGVPLSVLQAITLAESGRKEGRSIRPWPWTVNMEGEGHWFDTYPEARAYVVEQYKRGARSFDVGCFQINYKWHGEAFSSIDQMFDPANNALYAARFLSELFAETGSWKGAAGAYHSRTKEYADKYAARFEEIRQKLASGAAGPGADDIPEIPDIVAALNVGGAPARPPRVNTYPLLQRSGESRAVPGAAPGASLVVGAVWQDGSWKPITPSAGSLVQIAGQDAPSDIRERD